MLSSTPTSLRVRQGCKAGRRSGAGPRRGWRSRTRLATLCRSVLAFTLLQSVANRARPFGGPLARCGELDEDHDQQHPDGGDPDGELGEGVARAAAEGAGAADSAEGAGQPAPLAPLDQHYQDEEQADQEE